MIEIKHVSFKYDERFVLRDISLEIKRGSFLAIVGANGSGKSTLAKHLNGLLLPNIGEVLIEGKDTKKHSFEIRKKVGFVFQNFEDQLVYPIVSEDIAFGLENLGMSQEDILEKTQEIADLLQITKLLACNVNSLSMGQKQIVALAGVLVMNPEYIVFDEPTTMLDAANKRNILTVLKVLKEKNAATFIMATNSLDDLVYTEEVVVLREGRVLFNGKKDLLNKKTLEEAKLF